MVRLVAEQIISNDDFFGRSVFKTKANAISKLLADDSDVVVSLNGHMDKPRRGAFAITVGEGSAASSVLELLSLKRPFAPLRELDLDATVEQIKDKIRSARTVDQAVTKPVTKRKKT